MEPERAKACPASMGGRSREPALSQETPALPLAWKVPLDGQRCGHCLEEAAHPRTAAADRLETATS